MQPQSLPSIDVSGKSIIQREDQCLSIAGMLTYQHTQQMSLLSFVLISFFSL